jgi:hypothetical protein
MTREVRSKPIAGSVQPIARVRLKADRRVALAMTRKVQSKPIAGVRSNAERKASPISINDGARTLADGVGRIGPGRRRTAARARF